jgi:hypothetical protein
MKAPMEVGTSGAVPVPPFGRSWRFSRSSISRWAKRMAAVLGSWVAAF